MMQEAARRLMLFSDVLEMLARLREVAREIHPDTELRFVVLSSRYAGIIEAMSISDVFDRLLASASRYGPDDEAA